MKHKIIKIRSCKTCKEVLITRVRLDDSGNNAVEISAWHENKDGLYYQRIVVEFNDEGNQALLADRYVCDFSEMTANEFANSNTF